MNLRERANDQRYGFDGFIVDPEEFALSKDRETVPLTPRAFDVLLLLIENSGHVVEKREIFDTIWKDTFVGDNALSKIIKELRHALGDSAGQPRYIETVPKRGYRFIGHLDVEIENPGTHIENTLAHRRPTTIARSKRRFTAVATTAITIAALIWFAFAFTENGRTGLPTTIAVLPFRPLDSGSRDESLELGMAETLISRLSNLRGVVVRPIGSVRKFSDPDQDPIQAGQQLRTDAVVEGSIQKSADRIRVTVRLIDIRSGATLLTDQFDENFTDIFRVQDSIAQRIAGVLSLRLSRREQEQLAKHMTESPEAYEHFLRAQYHWHRRGPDWIRESLDAYKLALEKDPNFALAHIGVADAYMMLSGHRRISVAEAEANAVQSIHKALEIDDSLAQAHNALAELKYQYQYDWPGAEAEFQKAIDLNPNVAWIHQAYGWFLMSDGRFDEAAAEMERARQLDPGSITLSTARGRLYFFSRQYNRSIQQFRDLIALEPKDCSLQLALFTAYEASEMYEEALTENLKPEGCFRATEAEQEQLWAAYRSGGYESVVRKLLADLEAQSAKTGVKPPRGYAGAYARLKDKENAFYWLTKMFELRDVSLLQLKIDPLYDFLRDDPRYAELLARIGQTP